MVPAAGVLATYSYLKRYPTTATNLNRKRARFTLMYFLGTDIEELAPRDALDLDNEVGAIPTYQDPQCTVCHDVMDPVAGLFTKRNNGGDYDIDIVYEWTRTRFGVQRMVPAGFGNTRVNASAQLPDAYLERPLQWLGQRMAADDRFAVQTARKVLRSLTGTAAESASAVQFVNELRSAFVQSGYDFKALVKRIVTSEFFLARNLAATENPQAYSDLGTGRLMTPEELDRKLTAWLGAGYRWAGPATDSGLRGMHYLPYGGIDSDEIISRPTSATALIDGIQERSRTSSRASAWRVTCAAAARCSRMPASATRRTRRPAGTRSARTSVTCTATCLARTWQRPTPKSKRPTSCSWPHGRLARRTSRPNVVAAAARPTPSARYCHGWRS